MQTFPDTVSGKMQIQWVWQRVWQPVVSCIQTFTRSSNRLYDNRLYCVNGVSLNSVESTPTVISTSDMPASPTQSKFYHFPNLEVRCVCPHHDSTSNSAVAGGSRETLYVSWNLVNCCATVRKKSHLKKFATAKRMILTVTQANRKWRYSIGHTSFQ